MAQPFDDRPAHHRAKVVAMPPNQPHPRPPRPVCWLQRQIGAWRPSLLFLSICVVVSAGAAAAIDWLERVVIF